MVKTVSSREFNQDFSGAKRASKQGPVFITDRGKPSHVLLSIEEYRALSNNRLSVAEAFEQLPSIETDDFPRVMTGTTRVANFD